MKRYLLIATISVTALVIFALFKKEQDKPIDPVTPEASIVLLSHNNWAPDVMEGLNDFMTCYANKENAYAVFDFDNTTSIFDIEEQLAVYQLETMSFALRPSEFEDVIGTGLDQVEEADSWIDDISVAYNNLYSQWGPFSADGVAEDKLELMHKDKWWQEFSTKLYAMYGKVGEWVSTDASYCWELFWFTGMTDEQIYDLATRSHKKYMNVSTTKVVMESPADVASLVGQVSCTWTLGVSVSENIKELWKALNANGIDVWVCSASGLEQVKAAIDVFGLHDYVTGVTAMTIMKDCYGTYMPEYDFSGAAAIAEGNTWVRGTLRTNSVTAGPGKVVAIGNAIAPLYNGENPLAGFMDSTGDFYFCTEFASLKIVVCFNRADRKTTDGGGIIAEVAMYEKESLQYDLAKAENAGDTYYLLQGRNENGLRSLQPSNATLKYGLTEEKLFRDQDNIDRLNEMKTNNWTVKEAIDINAERAGFETDGYHSINE